MRIKYKILLFLMLLALIAIPAISAHEDDDSTILPIDSDKIKSNSILYTSIASGLVLLALLISLFYKNKGEKVKIFLFLLITIPVILTTFYLVGSTIYLNINSETKGPVHFHADFEVWNCGNKLDLIDPRGITNRVGSPLFHEHGDDRIHVEGTVIRKSTIQLHDFLEIVGGSLTESTLNFPTNSGPITIYNGDICNSIPGELQVFVYQITNPDPGKKSGFQYKQVKLQDIETYTLSPYQNVPPGDCIIIEFDSPKETTDKICETYRLAIQEGDIKKEN